MMPSQHCEHDQVGKEQKPWCGYRKTTTGL